MRYPQTSKSSAMFQTVFYRAGRLLSHSGFVYLPSHEA